MIRVEGRARGPQPRYRLRQIVLMANFISALTLLWEPKMGVAVMVSQPNWGQS